MIISCDNVLLKHYIQFRSSTPYLFDPFACLGLFWIFLRRLSGIVDDEIKVIANTYPSLRYVFGKVDLGRGMLLESRR
jgi:hypothetical protein